MLILDTCYFGFSFILNIMETSCFHDWNSHKCNWSWLPERASLSTVRAAIFLSKKKKKKSNFSVFYREITQWPRNLCPIIETKHLSKQNKQTHKKTNKNHQTCAIIGFMISYQLFGKCLPSLFTSELLWYVPKMIISLKKKKKKKCKKSKAFVL